MADEVPGKLPERQLPAELHARGKGGSLDDELQPAGNSESG